MCRAFQWCCAYAGYEIRYLFKSSVCYMDDVVCSVLLVWSLCSFSNKFYLELKNIRYTSISLHSWQGQTWQDHHIPECVLRMLVWLLLVVFLLPDMCDMAGKIWTHPYTFHDNINVFFIFVCVCQSLKWPHTGTSCVTVKTSLRRLWGIITWWTSAFFLHLSEDANDSTPVKGII